MPLRIKSSEDDCQSIIKMKQPNPITKITCAPIGLTATLLRLSAGIIGAAMAGYFVIKIHGVKWKKRKM